MAFNEQDFIQDAPALIAFYGKIRASIANPAGLGVLPAVNVTDKADVALAIAQANTGEFIGLVRTFLAQAAKPKA